MLNARGGYESDLTVMRLAPDRFLIVTGSAQAVHDADWIRRNIPVDAHVTLTDVTSSYAVLALMGPNARDILGRITSADLSNAGFPFSTICEIDIGYATAFANRMTYVGELGWELIVPSEFAVGVYEALHEAGRDLGLIDCGYYALEALRIEKGFRAWSRELTPDINPYEAGLAFAVSLDKPGGFIGREALVRARQAGPPVTGRPAPLSSGSCSSPWMMQSRCFGAANSSCATASPSARSGRLPMATRLVARWHSDSSNMMKASAGSSSETGISRSILQVTASPPPLT